MELVERQVDFLLGQTDSQAFLIQVEAFLRAVQTEPGLTAHLDVILQELADIVGEMEAVDAELSSELLKLRRELVALRPEPMARTPSRRLVPAPAGLLNSQPTGARSRFSTSTPTMSPRGSEPWTPFGTPAWRLTRNSPPSPPWRRLSLPGRVPDTERSPSAA